MNLNEILFKFDLSFNSNLNLKAETCSGSLYEMRKYSDLKVDHKYVPSRIDDKDDDQDDDAIKDDDHGDDQDDNDQDVDAIKDNHDNE